MGFNKFEYYTLLAEIIHYVYVLLWLVYTKFTWQMRLNEISGCWVKLIVTWWRSGFVCLPYAIYFVFGMILCTGLGNGK